MSKLIVDFFEMIEVENDNGQGIAISLGAGYLFLETIFAETTIVQSGERIQN